MALAMSMLLVYKTGFAAQEKTHFKSTEMQPKLIKLIQNPQPILGNAQQQADALKYFYFAKEDMSKQKNVATLSEMIKYYNETELKKEKPEGLVKVLLDLMPLKSVYGYLGAYNFKNASNKEATLKIFKIGTDLGTKGLELKIPAGEVAVVYIYGGFFDQNGHDKDWAFNFGSDAKDLNVKHPLVEGEKHIKYDQSGVYSREKGLADYYKID